MVYVAAVFVGVGTAYSPLLTNRLMGYSVNRELALGLSALAAVYAAVMVGFIWLVGR